MGFQKIPAGTRGRPGMKANGATRLAVKVMERYHHFRGDTFMGMDLLYLTTVGAKSGQERRVTLSRFADDRGWLVVASAGGQRDQPAWYHNIAAHPDQISAEVGGVTHKVTAEQLDGDERTAAWDRITAEQPRYNGYQGKTDRSLPIVRLIPHA